MNFSRYVDMRDPLENKKWRFLLDGWKEPTEFPFDEKRRRQLEGLGAFQWFSDQIKQRSFLLSMTQDASRRRRERFPFFHGWARARMWEQYAENHLGVCLAFHRERLIETILSSLQEQGFPSPYHHQVHYGSDGFQRHPLDLNDLAGDISPSQVSDYIERNHDALFFHKALDWETEHEYRFVTTSGDEDPPFVDFGDALLGVIVGGNFPLWARPGAIGASRRAGAQAEGLNWSTGGPMPVRLRSLEETEEQLTGKRRPES